MSEALVEQFLKTQHQNALNDAEEIKLRSKELEFQSKYAEKNLVLQAELLNSRPLETRKTLTRIGYIIGGFALLFLGFIVFCLVMDKDDFAYKFLQGVSYLVTTGLGYYFGKQKSKKDNGGSSGIQDAEVVN